MKNNKGFIPILIVLTIVGVLALGGGIYYYLVKNSQKSIGCTQEAKVCPDGSAVGRTGPNCEFAVCPEVKTGILEGRITIGPLCPVERIPPDPNCQPTEATYKAWQIAVYTLDKKTKIVQIEPDLDGSYQIELPVGNYLVDFEEEHMFGRSLPTSVVIEKEQTKVLNIDIDTGIR